MTAPTQTPKRPRQTAWGSRKALPLRWWFPLSMYAASRIIAAAYMLLAASHEHRSYSALATAWDGGWYRTIATAGYPASLPIGANGQVEQNAWAFPPGYPLLVRGVMDLTGLSFSAVAPALSLVLGAAAMVVLFALLEDAVSRFYACACVILTCTFMAAPVYQLAYAESMALLLVVSALLLLRKRRYVAVAALLLLLTLTRPVVIAFAPVVIAHGVSRWRRRASDPFPAKDRRAVVLLTGWCAATILAWPIIAGLATGDIFAWVKTQDAWRTSRIFGPGLGWPSSMLYYYGWTAVATLAVVVGLTLAIVLRRGARTWGPEIRVWALAYPAYLLLATIPGSSVIRWMVLAFPLMWPFPEPANSRSERTIQIIFIAGLAIVGLALQWVWVSSFVAATPPSVRYP
jgi:hypothetical protein